MKQWVIAGTLAGSLGLSGIALATQQPAPPAGSKPQATAEQEKAAAKKPAKKAAAEGQAGEHRAPLAQPNTAPEADVQAAAAVLGTVHLPRAAKADGKPLPAGVYQVRLTTEEAKPNAVGTSEKLERWVEFVQKGQVKGREVVSIVPKSEIKLVEKDAPPPVGGSKVQMLKGNEYMRVWINNQGNHYLIHLAAAA
jgi:hypothetical protein